MFGLPTGWNFSGINWDMTNDSLLSSQNIHWNLNLEKARLFPMLWSYPTADSLACTTYPGMDLNNILLNPMLAIKQWNSQRQNNGGEIFNFGGFGNYGFGDSFNNTGFFGQNGGMFGNITGSNNGGIFSGVFGGSNNGNSNSSGNSSGTTEQKELKKLADIYNTLKRDGEISTEIDNAYKEALKKSDDIEKLAAVKEVFEDIIGNETNAEKIKNSIYTDSDIKAELAELGFKFPDKKEDDYVKTVDRLKNAIKSDNESANDIQQTSGIVANNIMNYSRVWKEQTGQSIVSYISDHIPTKAEAKKACNGAVYEIANALILKASEFDSNEIKEKKEALRNTLENVNGNTPATKDKLTKIAKAYDELYATIKLTAAKEADKKIQEKYGYLNDIKPDFISKTLIYDSVVKELGEENIPANISDETVEQQAERMGLTKTTLCYKKGRDYYGVNNGKLEKLDNCWVDKNGRVIEHGTNTVVANSIAEYFEKNNKVNNEQETKTSEIENNFGEQADEIIADDCIQSIGKKVCKDLSGYTDPDNEAIRVKAYLSRIDKSNVEEFLRGYYNEKNCFDNGLFEQIASERGGGRQTNGTVVPVIEAIIELGKERKAAGELSDKQKNALAKIQDIYYEHFKSAPKEERFKNESGSWWYRLWGCDILDNLDDAVEDLLGL